MCRHLLKQYLEPIKQKCMQIGDPRGKETAVNAQANKAPQGKGDRGKIKGPTGKETVVNAHANGMPQGKVGRGKCACE